MKLLVVGSIDWTHPKSGGAEKVMKEILTRIEANEIQFLVSKHPQAPRNEEIEGIKIQRVGYNTNQANFNYPFLIKEVWKQHKNYDKIFINGVKFPFLPPERIDIIHNTLNKQTFHPVIWLRTKLSLAFNINSKAIAVSETAKKKAEKYYKEIKIIENGVDVQNFRNNLNNYENKTILFLGRMTGQKGINDLPYIAKNLPDEVQLKIAGRGSKDNIPEEIAEEHENCEYLGYVEESTKKELLAKSHVVIMPSRHEGHPLTVLEANASGTPVIGYESDGLKEILEESNNRVVDGRNELIEVIKTLKETESHFHTRTWDEVAKDYRCMFNDR